SPLKRALPVMTTVFPVVFPVWPVLPRMLGAPSPPPVRSAPSVSVRLTPFGAPVTQAYIPETCQLSNTAFTIGDFTRLLALGKSYTQLATSCWVRSKPAGP